MAETRRDAMQLGTPRAVLDVLGTALEDLWDNLFLGAGCSLLWLALTLLVLPAPGATIALFDIVRRVRGRESPGMGDYWRSVWKHFWVGWRWAALALPVVTILWIDFRVTSAILTPGMATAVQTVTLLALAIWCIVLAYALALLFRQEQMSVIQAVRNGGVMALQNPLYSVLLLLIAALFLWMSVLLVVVSLLAAPIFCAFLFTRAVDNRLQHWQAARPGA